MFAKNLSNFLDTMTGKDGALAINFDDELVKGTLIAVLAFSIVVLGYDTVWGAGGRPDWITQARTYPFINASSDALVKMIGERREAAAKSESKRLRGAK